MSLVETTKSGYSVNDHIRNAKSFRNPDILEKLGALAAPPNRRFHPAARPPLPARLL